MYKFFLTYLFIFLLSCKSKLPDGVIEQKKMEKVLWDILKADTYARSHISKDSTKNVQIENAKMQQQIFVLHKISKENFYKSYYYYFANADLIKPLLDSITNNSNKEKYSKYTTGQQGDTAILAP